MRDNLSAINDDLPAVDDEHPHPQIARLEARIEALAQSAERCRKLALLARGAIAAGAILIAAMALGGVMLDALPILIALSALIGGIVLLGSNNSTLHETETAMQEAEAKRNEMIGRIELREVGGGRP